MKIKLQSSHLNFNEQKEIRLGVATGLFNSGLPSSVRVITEQRRERGL